MAEQKIRPKWLSIGEKLYVLDMLANGGKNDHIASAFSVSLRFVPKLKKEGPDLRNFTNSGKSMQKRKALHNGRNRY